MTDRVIADLPGGGRGIAHDLAGHARPRRAHARGARSSTGMGGRTVSAAAGHGNFLRDLREAADRTDQARLSGNTVRIAPAEQAEWNLTQAAIDEAAEKEPEAGQ